VSGSSRLRYPWGTRLRLLLLFLTASLQSFEWQAVAIGHLGREHAAVQLGLASGFGILVTVLSLSALTLRGTPLGITPLPSRLLLLNSLFSWVTSLFWDDWPWAPTLMLVICSLQSSLFLLSHSVEIASTQRQNPAEYPAVRAFGNVDHLVGYCPGIWGHRLIRSESKLRISRADWCGRRSSDSDGVPLLRRFGKRLG
jgi:hypothetical protein